MSNQLINIYRTLNQALKSNAYHTQLDLEEGEITFKLAIANWHKGNGFHAIAFIIKEDIGKLYLSLCLGVETAKDGFQYIAGWQLTDSFETRLSAKLIGLPEYYQRIMKAQILSGIKSLNSSLDAHNLSLSNHANLVTSCSGMVMMHGSTIDLSQWIKVTLFSRQSIQKLTPLIPDYAQLDIKTYHQVSLESSREAKCKLILSKFKYPSGMKVKDCGQWEYSDAKAKLELTIKRQRSPKPIKALLTVEFESEESHVKNVTFKSTEALTNIA